jgi:hypothetical protein
VEPRFFGWRCRGDLGFGVSQHGSQRDGERNKRLVEIRRIFHCRLPHGLAFQAMLGSGERRG